jgi:hypothetical protein
METLPVQPSNFAATDKPHDSLPERWKDWKKKWLHAVLRKDFDSIEEPIEDAIPGLIPIFQLFTLHPPKVTSIGFLARQYFWLTNKSTDNNLDIPFSSTPDYCPDWLKPLLTDFKKALAELQDEVAKLDEKLVPHDIRKDQDKKDRTMKGILHGL